MAACAVLLGAASTAHAKDVSLYVRGQSGWGGTALREFAPGQTDRGPTLGKAYGAEAGFRVLALSGYVSRDEFSQGGRIDRAVLGVGFETGEILRLTLRAGAGVARETGDVLGGGQGGDRDGKIGRAGIGLDIPVAPSFWFGVGLDAEYYVFTPVHGGPQIKGYDLFGALRLSFEVGQ